MKAFANISPVLLESKLAIGLFAGFFVALVMFFSEPPQFAVRSPNGEPPVVYFT